MAPRRKAADQIAQPIPQDFRIIYTLPVAVDKINAEAAAQYEDIANKILEDAQVVAAVYRTIASAIRDHGQTASEQIVSFASDMKHLMDNAGHLRERLSSKREPEEAAVEVREGTRLPEAPQLRSAPDPDSEEHMEAMRRRLEEQQS